MRQGGSAGTRSSLKQAKEEDIMNIAHRIEIDPKIKSYVSTARPLLIGGKWVAAVSGKTFPVYDPSTGNVLAQVAEAEQRMSTRPCRLRATHSMKAPGRA
jgi:hypothetical protein